jgi:hybrid polyketide synthase/nonribosomal peptide synthetase ACE1
MELNNSEDRAQIMAKRTDDFGIDSLVAVEIRTWFLKTLGVNVPVLKILGGAIIEDIVIYAAEKVDPGLIPNMGNPDVATLPLVATQTPMTKADHPKPSPIPDKDAEQSIKLSWTPRNESSYPDQVDSATGSSTNNPSITRSSPDSVVDGSCQTSRSSGSSGLKALVSFDPSDSRNLGNSHDMPFNTRTNARSPPSQTSYITKGSVQGQEIRRGRLSFGQELFFFVHHFTKQSSALNHTGAFKITGSIDVEKLKKGVEAISVRHEALRTRYVYDTDQTPIQVVLDRSQLHLEIVEIGSKSDVETSFKLLASYGYKIERGETMRVLLLRNPNGASYLLLGCHHINVDGVTFKALLADLEQGYNQKPFNTPTVQFLDHANHERSDYERGRFNVDLNYWKSKFLNTPAPLPVLNLPGAHKRRPLMNYEFSRAQIQLESDLVSSIRRASTSLRATPFQFYLAAFLVLLARFTDNNEVCIGLCDANRTSPESMGAVGAYVNLVPLLLSADPNSPFSKALHQVKEEALKALSHAQVPFGLLLSELRVDRSEMFSPLFQAFIDYRLGHKQHEQFADCQLELLNFEQGRTAYDVNLDIFETEKGCTIDLMLQKSLYTDHDAQILSEAYRALVIAFSTDTHQAIGVPSLFSLRDISKAITVGTGPVKHSEWPDSIMGRIQNICSRFPYNIAVTDGLGSTLTYNQLSTRTNSISHTLMSSGVHVGTRVGVFQHPTTDWICSLLAIWSLGAVYVPLDLSIPSARLAKMVQDSEPSVVLTSEETFEQVDDVVGDWILTINVDNVSTSWNRPIKLEIDPKAVCAIFYTSGSTGIPKGIALTTENIRDEIEFAATSYGIEREKVLQQSSLGFDMSLTQILCALAFGGSLHMMLFEARGDPGATVKILDKEHITMTGGTPSEYQSWLQYRKLNGDSPLPSWRLAISGGEQVPRALLDSFSSLGNAELRLYNAYGPTEVTCSSHRMELDYRNHVSAYTDDRIPAGFAVPNTFTYILDDRDQPVPVGMSGQIAIGGAGVALGYTNDDALTKERFIENSHNNSPHGAEGCQTIHKTGDRGRLLTDGRLVVEGRIAGDTQVKISGGLRVDVLDIESTLIQESEGQIHEAIVTLYRDDDGVETLVLHAVCSPQVSQVDGQGYVRRLITNSSLPRFMRPSVIETVNQLPRTSSGKADRRAVADLVRITKSRNSSTSVSVLSDEQAELLHLWTATLPQLAMEQGSISQDTDFFHVGGTSMLLIALRHRIHDTFGVDLTVLDLFRSSTIKDMALLIEEHSRLVDDIKMDWRMEVALPDLGTTFPYAETSHSLPLSVVLTGATGFLGTQLLCKLLADDRIQAVYCIAVRQPRRLTRTYNTSKLKVYEGDLTLQGFGLSNQDSTMIFSAADAIIHNGADVSHLKVYPTLKQANTNSTLQLIELCAARGRKIPIHFISSAGVALWSGLEVFDERSAAEWEPPTNGFDGYTASKWVSERLLEQACDLYGLPVIIHRPSNISREGEAPDMDLFQNLLRYCSELNAVPRSPNLTGTLNLVSVQDCSRMILEAVFAPNSGRKAQYVNEIGPTNLDLSNLGGFLQGVEQRDTVIREIGLGEWVDLAERAGLNPAVAAFFRRVERDISSKVHYPKLKKNKL